VTARWVGDWDAPVKLQPVDSLPSVKLAGRAPGIRLPR